ncbi:DNA/RNA polymerases superfamily protein [Gossypium australe]|uniref:DNA/RNA polymerases superfamily protein n=1 Tax=Gossypium australe TaxID=47621 RepID=A0A5B6UX64_9ROSI|nr:DNA/RNA polymerases superfamily protein [Gossypium australe]
MAFWEKGKATSMIHWKELDPWRIVWHYLRNSTESTMLSHFNDLMLSEESIRILAREVNELRHKCVPFVKVLWHRHEVEEATWETEDSMKSL